MNADHSNPDQSKLDQLISHCDFIVEHCSSAGSSVRADVGKQLASDCKQLVDSAKLIDTIAVEFKFEDLPTNGFAVYLQLVSAYTELIGQQIKRNDLDFELVKMIKLIFLYRDGLLQIYGDLKKERQNGKEPHLIVRNQTLSSPFLYERVNCSDDAMQLKFSKYMAFWLPADLRRMLKFLSRIFAVRYKPPFTLPALFSNKIRGKTCAKLYSTPNLDYPFDVWQTSENWFVMNSINFFTNLKVPVKSRTLYVPRQQRIRLDHRGNILDFDTMTREQKYEYSQDQEEQERQKSPGRRFRNKNKIRCRFSFIKSKNKTVKSQERVRNNSEPKPTVLNYHTVRRSANGNPSNDKGEGSLRNDNDEGSLTNDNDEHSLTIDEGSLTNDKGNLKNDKGNHNDGNSADSGAKANPLNPENKLLLFFHGGGFFTQGSQSYELFLRSIVNELGGIPILAVDYSLTVPYPIPLQEILDVYLWLMSGTESVQQKLGFHPQKIILSGDSCGGTLSLALTIVLNELNVLLEKSANGSFGGNSNNQLIRLPIAIVAEYPAFTLSSLSPSLALSVFDSVVEGHLFMLIISVYGANLWTVGDFKRIEKGERYQAIAVRNEGNEGKFKQPNSEQMMGIAKNCEDDGLPWYRCDYATYVNRADYIDSFYDHPFINPPLYREKFDELKEVALYLMVGDSDFLLDNSIELARTWKGKVSLDVFEKVIHGFMQFTAFSVESREAFEVIIKRYQEACFSN